MKTIRKKIEKIEEVFKEFTKLDTMRENYIEKSNEGLNDDEREEFLALHAKRKETESQLKREINSAFKQFGYIAKVTPVFQCDYKEIIQELKDQYNKAVEAFYNIGVFGKGNTFFEATEEKTFGKF